MKPRGGGGNIVGHAVLTDLNVPFVLSFFSRSGRKAERRGSLAGGGSP